MQMLYNSDNFAVVQFDVPASAGAEEHGAPVGLMRGGYEIVDKFARKEIFLEGALAESFKEGVQKILQGGGMASLPHPIRVPKNGEHFENLMGEMLDAGLQAIEVYHSDHSPADVAQYLDLAARYGLAITGGSDFHGANKPRIQLGRGLNGNLDVPRSVLDHLRAM